MKHQHWLISTRADGVHQRCRFDGRDWHVILRTPDGREAASNDVLLMDAADKAAMLLGVPRNHELPPDTPMTRGEAVRDPVAIVNEAIHERNAALRRFGDRVLPPWEWILASAAVAFAVVAWVYA